MPPKKKQAERQKENKMLLYSVSSFYNPFYVTAGNKAHQINKMAFHDGEKVLFTNGAWFGSNREVDKIEIPNIECLLKRKPDLTVPACLVKEYDEYAISSSDAYTLYMNVNLFQFVKKQYMYCNTLINQYKSQNIPAVHVEQWAFDYQKGSKHYEYDTIYKTIETLNNQRYDMTLTLSNTQKLSRQIRKYNQMLATEKAEEQADKEILKNGGEINKQNR